jgi:2-polyprenyl-3-methyl-5-hydroxy-6-metoxy-1,4-benzoquinol methylase
MDNMNDVYQELKKCDNCGSDQFKIQHHFPANFYDHKYYHTSSWDGGIDCSLTIVKCKKCNLIYQNPAFKLEHFGSLYPEEQIPESIPYTEIMSEQKFDFLIQNFIKKHSPSTTNPVTIDIGSRYGALTENLKKSNYKAYGLDYNAKCAEVAAKAGIKNISQGTIDDVEKLCREQNIAQVNSFTLVDVIEHLICPTSDIGKLAKWQKSGDKIYMVTMNANSLGYKLFGKYWYYIHGQHTYYYTPGSLNDLMKKHNYLPIDEFKIKSFKNVTIIFSELKKLFKHKKERKNIAKMNNSGKVWFAETRPALFDMMTIVYEKK